MIFIIVSVYLLLLVDHNNQYSEACNLFKGRWVFDPTYPFYNSSDCPFIEKVFNCQGNGRPDHAYLKYRWQPHNCHLRSFCGYGLLHKLKKKSIMFVGDSLSRDQYQSLLCMIYTSVPGIRYNQTRERGVSAVNFLDFEVAIKLNTNLFLVDAVREKIGRVLKLDSVAKKAPLWLQNDVLVFNTYAWWGKKGIKKPWDFVRLGNITRKELDRTAAFKLALYTWAWWVDHAIDPAKTRVFFQTASPTHYNGSEWGEPNARKCRGQTEPVLGPAYPGRSPEALGIQKGIIGKIRKHAVTLLDITELSELRKDGHPAAYGQFGKHGMDCLHWCVGGVPDTWNEILYNFLI